MSDILDTTELERLGLQGAVSRGVVEYEIPEEVACGRAMPLRHPVMPGEPTEVAQEARIRSLGTACRDTMALELIESVVRVTARDEIPLHVTALDEAVTFTIAPPHVAFVSGTGRVVIQRPDGLVLVVKLAEGRVPSWEEPEVPGEDVPLFAEVEVDLARYIAMVENSWLRTVLEAHDQEDTYTRLVGLGLVRRFFAVTCGRETKRQIIRKILAGEWEPPTADWSKSLEPAQVETIIALATAAESEIRRELMELMDNFAPSDPSWIEAYVRVCHARDDLEGVAWLLPGDEIRASLRDLDAFARRITVAVPPGLAPDDERLLWASRYDWDQWWTEPVRDPADFELPI